MKCIRWEDMPLTSNIHPHPPLRFLPVALPLRDRVEAIRAGSGNTLYVHSFASLFAWQADEGYRICLSDDAFLVRYGARGDGAYLFPCGSDEGKRRLIDALLEQATPDFFYLRDADKRFLEREYPGWFSFEACRDDYSYLYDREAQLAMEGKEFKNLRHQVNLGRAVADRWTTEPLTEDNLARALEITRRWAEGRAAGDPTDVRAVETALRHFSSLGLWGALFQADGEDIAYVAGTFLTPEIFDICFSKVLDSRCDCFIKWALYRVLPPGVTTVDSEEDMGLPGLRTHKLLRHPKELVRVWKGSLR